MRKGRWVVLIATLLFIQCHKTQEIQDENLLGKSLLQIKAATKGNWQVKRRQHVICPFLPPCILVDSFYRNNEGDRFSFFLANDHFRNTNASETNTKFDESPTLVRIRYSSTTDSVYAFRIATGNHQYLMREIRQDTLIMEDYSVTYYLTAKP